MSKKSDMNGDAGKHNVVEKNKGNQRSLSYQEIVQLTNNMNDGSTDRNATANDASSGGALDGSVSMSDI